ncbi:MAG TPA: hypothetical protein VF240_10725 [Pyrinomonadaceae bacterium]
MLWTMRLVIFVFALVFGAGCWYVFAQTPSAQTTNTNVNGNMNANNASAEDAAADWTPVPTNTNNLPDDQSAEAHEEEAAPALEWAEPNPAYGHVVAPRVTLRSESNASSNIIATLDVVENESVEIMDSTRDFLRVKFPANTEMEGGTRQQDYDGWVEWGAVVPYTNALVVETESGEVIGRVALDYGISTAAFSPDGSRAVFYGASGGDGHGESQSLAYEFDTESYKILRTLKTSTSGGFASILYDDGGDLRPLLQTHLTSGDSMRKMLQPFRVKGDLFERSGDTIRPGADGPLLFSRDGATGFDIHSADEAPGAISVDVIDVKSFTVRNSFPVEGTASEPWSYEYAVSPDGAEFFYRESEGSIRVVDTRTGLRVRETRPRVAEDFRGYLANDSVVGDSLLIRYWQESESEEGGELRSFWLKADGETTPAERGINNVVEAGGALYAVNDAGTRLFKLDADGRITERLKIARPELKHRPKGSEEHTIMGLYASPDGKHIVIFFGIPDGC